MTGWRTSELWREAWRNLRAWSAMDATFIVIATAMTLGLLTMEASEAVSMAKGTNETSHDGNQVMRLTVDEGRINACNEMGWIAGIRSAGALLDQTTAEDTAGRTIARATLTYPALRILVDDWVPTAASFRNDVPSVGTVLIGHDLQRRLGRRYPALVSTNDRAHPDLVVGVLPRSTREDLLAGAVVEIASPRDGALACWVETDGRATAAVAEALQAQSSLLNGGAPVRSRLLVRPQDSTEPLRRWEQRVQRWLWPGTTLVAVALWWTVQWGRRHDLIAYRICTTGDLQMVGLFTLEILLRSLVVAWLAALLAGPALMRLGELYGVDAALAAGRPVLLFWLALVPAAGLATGLSMSLLSVDATARGR